MLTNDYEQQVTKKRSTGQVAHGNYIAQADREGTAIVKVIHQSPLEDIAAIAPLPPRNFIGRTEILKKLKDNLLLGKSVTLIALQGMGGIGKTAIAQKLAADLSEFFLGGIFWASLPDSNGDPRPILRAWARSCACDFPSDLDPVTMATLIRGLLAERQLERGNLLMIVDDIRQEWITTALLLKSSLPQGTAFLLTTRSEDIARSLDADVYHLQTFRPNESLMLLGLLTGEGLIQDNFNEATQLVNFLGHLPLAIQITGKKLTGLVHKPGFSLAAFCREISVKETQILALPGHPGLAATFQITYDGMDEVSQRLFRWIGAFSTGPIRLEDVIGLIRTRNSETLKYDDIEPVLDNLVQLALLDWGKSQGIYSIHPLVHQYAQVLLNSSEEELDVYKVHIDFFSNLFLVQSAEGVLTAQLGSKLPNLLLAAQRAYELKHWDKLKHMANMLANIDGYLYIMGYWDEAIELLLRALDASKQQKQTNFVISFLFNLAMIKRERGFYEEAKNYFEQAVEQSQKIADLFQLSRAIAGLGYVYLYQADYDTASHVFDETIKIASKANNKGALAEGLVGSARVRTAIGDPSEALHLVERSIPLFEEIHDDRGLMWALRVLGNIFELKGDYEAALEHLDRSIKLAKELGHQQAEAYMLRAIGDILFRQTKYSKAIKCFRESENICRDTGEQAALVASLCRIGDVHIEEGKLEPAKNAYVEAIELARKLELNRWHGRGLFGLAKVFSMYPNIEEKKKARSFATEASSILERIGHRDARLVEDWIREMLN